ncbi:MAG TPA: D-mannonate dehydratase [Bacteroides sp.]|nr:D-mannonate dehydratase [Bacteroides sp.]
MAGTYDNLSEGLSKTLPSKPLMKIAYQSRPEPTEDEIRFIQQMGVDHVVLWTNAEKSSYEYYNSRRQMYQAAGIKVFGFGNIDVHNQDTIVLNLPGRDAKIEEYKNHLRNLGKAGIPYTTYAHMGNGIWSTDREPTRGGASARGFNLEEAEEGLWAGKVYKAPLTHGRIYTKEEIWDNYEYFIKAVAPVAEEANVRIGIHPDDPPVPELGGVPRCIFSNFDGYKRAMEIADSPNVGICLCVGCWLEGGKLMGKDVFETIKYFGERKKIFKVHLRNISQPLPHFVETFMDDGYGDIYKVLKSLKEVDFDGVIIADHIPRMVGSKTGTAFTIGYMKGLLERVIAEG